jgi:hypothetical protein
LTACFAKVSKTKGSGVCRATKEVRAKEMCHSTKRTHFIFALFLMHHFYLQKLTKFAAAFANGFVSGKRTHFEVLGRGF